ncbi:hypothetical protein AAG906_010153 [Vitis piasezkii]
MRIFSPNGVVEGFFIIQDDMKQSCGCGFVKLPNKDMVVAAIKALNGNYVSENGEIFRMSRTIERRKDLHPAIMADNDGNYVISYEGIEASEKEVASCEDESGEGEHWCTSMAAMSNSNDGGRAYKVEGDGVVREKDDGDQTLARMESDRSWTISFHGRQLLVGIFDDLRYTRLPQAQNQFVDALNTLASSVDISTYVVIRPLLIESRQSADAMLLLCLDQASANRVMREVHAGVCGPHMRGHMLAHKIMRTNSTKSSNGHEFILVSIDYFTKWVEVASYARLTYARVVGFIISHIIYRYGVSHELISDRGPQTNRTVEATNKNIKKILRKMVETFRDWLEKLSFALWAYRTSFRTSTGATPYSLVYGMEIVLPVETEMGSLRVALEQQISETEWA